MGFKFRKSIKILPGVKVNLTSKGISSASIGTKGANINVGKKGVKTTISIPNTGLSYSENLTSNYNHQENAQQFELSGRVQSIDDNSEKDVNFLLAVGIFIMPYIFSWALLEKGYSQKSRYIAFGWLACVLFSFLVNMF